MTTTHLTDLGQAAADLKSRSWRMLIDGELVEGADTVPVINPATEEVLAQSPVADEGQVNDAVRAASNAFPAWRDLTPTDRGRYLKEIADAIAERADEFALIVTLEQGKTLEASRGDVDAAIAFTNYFASLRPAPEILRDDEEARIELPAKAPRRCRGDTSLELSVFPGDVQVGAGASDGQHNGHEAGSDDAAQRDAARRVAQVAAPTRGCEYRGRQRKRRPNADRSPRRRENFFHRIDGDRQSRNGERGADAKARDARAGRQRRSHRPR